VEPRRDALGPAQLTPVDAVKRAQERRTGAVSKWSAETERTRRTDAS